MNRTQLSTLLVRLADCIDILKALRVSRHFSEWPPGHPEAPNPRPRHVREFEQSHGPVPASAERLLEGAGEPAMTSECAVGVTTAGRPCGAPAAQPGQREARA